MKYFVTGGAGFIGSNMVDRLLEEQDNEVVVYDNFSTGRREFLEEASKNDRFTLVEGDTLDEEKLKGAVVRTRGQGDYIKPLGCGGTKKLKELFIDEKISVGNDAIISSARRMSSRWSVISAASSAILRPIRWLIARSSVLALRA